MRCNPSHFHDARYSLNQVGQFVSIIAGKHRTAPSALSKALIRVIQSGIRDLSRVDVVDNHGEIEVFDRKPGPDVINGNAQNRGFQQ